MKTHVFTDSADGHFYKCVVSHKLKYSIKCEVVDAQEGHNFHPKL